MKEVNPMTLPYEQFLATGPSDAGFKTEDRAMLQQGGLFNGQQVGVFATGGTNGVHGKTNSSNDSGVWGENTGNGYRVRGSSASGEGVLVRRGAERRTWSIEKSIRQWCVW
jgi:hypothetical protein